MSEPLDLAAAIKGAVVAFVGGGGVWAYLSVRAKRPVDMVQNAAAFQKALSDQGLGFIGELRGEIESLRQAMTAMEIKHAIEIAELRREHQVCQSENAQLEQRIESLQAHLRRSGIDIPDFRKARPFVVLHGDGAGQDRSIIENGDRS